MTSDKALIESYSYDLARELRIGGELSNLENLVLRDLINKFQQKEFPVQAGALFRRVKKGVVLHMASPELNKKLVLSENSFVQQRISNYENHRFGDIIFHRPSLYWRAYELRGIEEILDYFGLEKDKVLGVADFVFPIRKIPIIAVLINPFSPKAGVATKEIVPFSDKDIERLKKFLDPYYKMVSDFEAAVYEETINILQKIDPELKKIPSLKECEAYSFLEQKTGNFGGDFRHAVIKGEKALYFLGDVCGKSVCATGLRGCLRNSLTALTLESIPDLNNLMNSLNKLASQYHEELFATGFAFTIDKKGRFVYSSAGHLGYILKKDGSYEELESLGYFLGTEEQKYECREMNLSQGDIIAVWTDGYNEATDRNKEQFGNERVLECLKASREGSLNGMVKSLELRISDFSPNFPEDDRAIMLVRYNG